MSGLTLKEQIFYGLICNESASSVLDAVMQRSERRHGRLEDKAEGHRPTRSFDKIMPDALANLRGEAVRGHAESDEGDH